MCIVALSPMARVALPMVEWHRKTTAVGHGLGLVPPVVQAQVSQVSCACGRVRACVRACVCEVVHIDRETGRMVDHISYKTASRETRDKV